MGLKDIMLKFLSVIIQFALLAYCCYLGNFVIKTNRLLFEATVQRNIIQDHRQDRHMEHLKRHQRIMNGYFRTGGLIDKDDTTFWLGGYEEEIK